MTNTNLILESAQRVLENNQRRLDQAAAAYTECEHKPTLSNAIRRDDARKNAEGAVDAVRVARWVIEDLTL